MTCTFSVGSLKQSDTLKNVLNSCFTEYNMSSPIKDNNKGNYTFYTINLPYDETEHFASMLAEFILNYCEEILISQIVKQQYYYFSPEEREKIHSKAMEILNPSSGTHESYRDRRKRRVQEKIVNYLAFNKELILEGFINFRLKDYCYELELAVEEAVDDYLIEKEYDEFIRLLKYFVDIQEPKIKKVHVVLENTGYFRLYDEENKLINNDYLEGFIVELMDDEINYEDLLISALITIAPEIVILHQSKMLVPRVPLKPSGVFSEKGLKIVKAARSAPI